MAKLLNVVEDVTEMRTKEIAGMRRVAAAAEAVYTKCVKNTFNGAAKLPPMRPFTPLPFTGRLLSHQAVACLPHLVAWGVGMAFASGAAMAAQPQDPPARELVCQMRYGSETFTLRQAPGRDPYAAATVEMPQRFRLRAVVLGTPTHIEHVTLTSYQLDEGQPPVVLHQIRMKAPFGTQQAIPDLTGWQHVYASGLGREMRFGCALLPPSAPDADAAAAKRPE
jgi:hypothetical protein